MKLQSAMEFLLTYGWAILIIVVAVSALYFLGVFNPSLYVGQECALSSGLSCKVARMATNGMATINLFQANPYQINITAISCNSNNTVANVLTYPAANQVSLAPGTNATLTAPCYSGPSLAAIKIGSAFSGYIFISYNETLTGFPHTAYGRLIGKAS